MATNKRSGGRRGPVSGRDGVPENAIARYEPEFQRKAYLGEDTMTERLRRALEAADGSVQKASNLGRYELSQIALTCSLRAGSVVLDVSGALALSWTLPKPTPGTGPKAQPSSRGATEHSRRNMYPTDSTLRGPNIWNESSSVYRV